MAGTKAGGKLCAETNKLKYGKDYYRNIGRMGGKNGKTGGFYGNPEAARIAGAKGGANSKPYSKTKRPTTVTATPTKPGIFGRLAALGR